jgi:hypothetical protein
MPFRSNDVRPFTRIAIEALDEGQTGVYGIFRENQWIYIGRGDIRERLLDHLNGDNDCIIAWGPTHWIAEVTPYPLSREIELTVEFNPPCNQRVG